MATSGDFFMATDTIFAHARWIFDVSLRNSLGYRAPSTRAVSKWRMRPSYGPEEAWVNRRLWLSVDHGIGSR